MALDPKLRSAGLHVGTAVSSALATAMWLASSKTDIYAMIDQFNAVVVEIGKLVTMVTAVAGGAYQVWKSTQKGLVSDVNDLAKLPDSPVKAIITENTAAGRALADSLPGPIVAAGSPAAEVIIK